MRSSAPFGQSCAPSDSLPSEMRNDDPSPQEIFPLLQVIFLKNNKYCLAKCHWLQFTKFARVRFTYSAHIHVFSNEIKSRITLFAYGRSRILRSHPWFPKAPFVICNGKFVNGKTENKRQKQRNKHQFFLILAVCFIFRLVTDGRNIRPLTNSNFQRKSNILYFYFINKTYKRSFSFVRQFLFQFSHRLALLDSGSFIRLLVGRLLLLKEVAGDASLVELLPLPKRQILRPF